MAIAWNTSFTLPTVQALDKGLVKSNADYANLIARNYHASILTGMPIGAPPTPFPFGNATGMAAVIERWLNINRYNFLKRDIKSQYNQIKIIQARIRYFKSVRKDITNQLNDIRSIERDINQYIKRVKSNLSRAGINQIKKISEVNTALLQYPNTLLQAELAKINNNVDTLQSLLSLKNVLSFNAIGTKFSEFNTLLRQTFELLNGIIFALKTTPDIIIGSVVTVEFNLINVNDFIDAFEFDRFVILNQYASKAKIWLQQQINEINETIQRTIKTSLEPSKKRIQESSNQRDQLGKLILYKDSKSLVKQLKSITNASIRHDLQQIKDITRRILQIYGRMIVIKKRINNIIRQINTIKATGDKIGIIDSSQGGSFSTLLSPYFDGMTMIEMGTVISLGLITEIDTLSSEFLSLQRDLGIYTKSRSDLYESIQEKKKNQQNSITKLSNDLQPVNSFVNKVILTTREVQRYKALIKTYTSIIKSTKLQIKTLKDVLRFTSQSLRIFNSIPSIQQINRIRQNLSVFRYIDSDNKIISSVDFSLQELIVALQLNKITEVSSLLLGIRQNFGTIDNVIHSKLEQLTISNLTTAFLSKTRILSETQRKFNPASVSFTNCISKALRVYWQNGTWPDLSGIFRVTIPGTNLLFNGGIITAAPARVSTDLIKEFERAFILHSKFISGTYVNNTSGVSTVWNGYM